MPTPEPLSRHSCGHRDLAGLGRVVGVRAARIVEVGLAVAVVVDAVAARPCRRRASGVAVGVGSAARGRRRSRAWRRRWRPAPARRGAAAARRARAWLSTASAPAGAALPHSLAASTAPRPLTSAEPFSCLLASAARSLQFGALPPLSAAAIVLVPFALPLTVSTTLPVACTPRGRTTATTSLPFLTPPATVTPAGADFTFTLLTPEANVTETWPSAGTGIDGPAASAAGAGYQQDTQGQERKAESGEHGRDGAAAAEKVHQGIP